MNAQELRTIGALAALDDASLARISTVLEEHTYGDGQVVCHEGEPGDSMFFILRGAIRVEKKTGADASQRKTLAFIEAGDHFGEMVLMDQAPRSATCVAMGETRALRLSKVAFDSLSTAGGQTGLSVLFAMIRTAGERIRRLSKQVVVYDEIGKAIGESKNLEQLLGVILNQLAQATAADWGMVVLRAQFADRLELRSHLGLQLTPAQEEEVISGHGFLGPVLKEGRDRLVRDFEAEDAFKGAPRIGFESAAMLLALLVIDNQSLGVIVLGGRKAGHFVLNDLNLVRGVARQAAQAILNARHRDEEAARERHAKHRVRF